MREFNFTMNSQHQEILDRVFSSVLPHKNFDKAIAGDIIEELFRILPKQEVYGINYIFYNVFENLRLIPLYRKGFSAQINADIFHNSVEINVDEFIRSPMFNAQLFFQERGKEFVLTEPMQYNDAVNFILSAADEMYDALMELAIPTSEGISQLVLLTDSLKQDICDQIIRIQAEIQAAGFKGRTKTFRGPLDVIEFANQAYKELGLRFKDASSNVRNRFIPVTIHSYDESLKFDTQEAIEYKELFKFGWEPLDAIFRPATGDIITIIAPEGTGKTRLGAYTAHEAVKAGVNVAIVCGETRKKKYKRMIEGAHLFETQGIQLSPREMDNLFLLTHDLDRIEEISMQIKSSQLDLYENSKYGKLTFVTTAYYEESYETFEKLILEENVGFIIIDHTKSLTNNGAYTPSGRLQNIKLSIDYLMDQEIALAQDYPVCFMNMSHPSVEAQNSLNKGKDPGVRAGGNTASVTQGASMVGILTNDKALQAQDMVILQLQKVRDAAITVPSILLDRLGYSNKHVYDPSHQYMVNSGGEEMTDSLFKAMVGDDSGGDDSDSDNDGD